MPLTGWKAGWLGAHLHASSADFYNTDAISCCFFFFIDHSSQSQQTSQNVYRRAHLHHDQVSLVSITAVTAGAMATATV
jgi:hypothetical protein